MRPCLPSAFVGIGGLDQNGARKGFDLDAASLAAVPEPSTGVVAWTSRRQRRTT